MALFTIVMRTIVAINRPRSRLLSRFNNTSPIVTRAPTLETFPATGPMECSSTAMTMLSAASKAQNRTAFGPPLLQGSVIRMGQLRMGAYRTSSRTTLAEATSSEAEVLLPNLWLAQRRGPRGGRRSDKRRRPDDPTSFVDHDGPLNSDARLSQWVVGNDNLLIVEVRKS